MDSQSLGGRPMTRNIVEPETAEFNCTDGLPGLWTFHAPIDAVGPALGFEVVRIGDHAHVHVRSGRARSRRPGDESYVTGFAGKLVLRWDEWGVLRDVLDSDPRFGIYEVENPRVGQARYYAGAKP